MEIYEVIGLGGIGFIISAFEGAVCADLADREFIGVHRVDCP